MPDVAVTVPTQSPGKNQQLVAAAIDSEKKFKSSTYLEGGKTIIAFDCSYFVYLVIKSVFPNYIYLSSSGIISSNLFEKITEMEPGAIIYFPPSVDRWWQKTKHENPNKIFPAHVGIVLNDREWIGRQKSSLGRVSFTDQYFWGTRTMPTFYRFKGVKTVDMIYLQSRSK